MSRHLWCTFGVKIWNKCVRGGLQCWYLDVGFLPVYHHFLIKPFFSLLIKHHCLLLCCPLDCLCIFVAMRIYSTKHLVSALYTFQHNLSHTLIIKCAASIDEMPPKSIKCSQSWWNIFSLHNTPKKNTTKQVCQICLPPTSFLAVAAA